MVLLLLFEAAALVCPEGRRRSVLFRGARRLDAAVQMVLLPFFESAALACPEGPRHPIFREGASPQLRTAALAPGRHELVADVASHLGALS